MRVSNALIKKEVLVFGKKLFIPVWIVAAIYGMLLIGIIVSLFIPKEYMEVNGRQMSLEEALNEFLPVDITGYGNVISYLGNYILAYAVSLLLLLNLLLVTANILNVNKKENYEMFHRTIPVSVLKTTFAKLVAAAGGNWLVFFGICLFNYLVFNIFFSIELRNIITWNFGLGFLALLHLTSAALIVSFILVALAFLVSAIFQESAIVKAGGILIGMHAIVLVFNRLYGWGLPSPLRYFQSLLKTMNINLTGEELLHFTTPGWSMISWNTLIHLMVAAVFFLAATYLYSKREIR